MPNINIFNVNKRINNNLQIFYSGNKNKSGVVNDDLLINKIANMFKSNDYIYKIDADILMKDGRVIKNSIIGFYNNEIVTIDDSIIPISEIADIEY